MWETKQGLNCCQLAVCVWTTVGLQCVNATERNMRPGEVEGKERNMHINWLMRTGAGKSRPLQRLEWGWGEGVPKWSEKPFLQGSIVCWPWLWKESWLQETACCVASTVACSWSLHVAVSSDVSLLLSPPKKKKSFTALRCDAWACFLRSELQAASVSALFFPASCQIKQILPLLISKWLVYY